MSAEGGIEGLMLAGRTPSRKVTIITEVSAPGMAVEEGFLVGEEVGI